MKVKITVNANCKIMAIKTVRIITGLGLKDAKDYVEAALDNQFGISGGGLDLTGKSLFMTVDTDRADIESVIRNINADPYSARDGVFTAIVPEFSRKLDFTVSITNDDAELCFKGPKIEAKMNVPSNKMLDVVKWVTENF